METKTKKALSLVGMIAGVTLVMGLAIYFLYSQVEYLDLVGKSIVISEEDDRLQVVDEDDRVVFDYSITDWRNHVEGRWDNFLEEPIMVGETELKPQNFQRFVAASPLVEPTEMVFAVATYAMPTDFSLFFVIDIRSGELSFVGEPNKGVIGNIIWSPTGKHFAYFLNTDRAPGDYLTVDNAETLEKEFTLEDEDILLGLGVSDEEIGDGEIEFAPEFRSLEWDEDGERLLFTTNSLEEGEDADWSINADGTDILLKTQEE